MSSDTAPIQRFMARVRQAAQSGSRDIRLTLPEATELAATLGQVLAAHMEKTASSPAQSPQKRNPDDQYRGPTGRVTMLDGGALKR